MPNDIRNYFFSSKPKESASNDVHTKPRKQLKKVISSDEDESKLNISINKKTKSLDDKKKIKVNEKSHSKKRMIISSDEDDIDVTDYAKNKKVKVTEDNRKSNHGKEAVDLVIEPSKAFSKKPVKRISTDKIAKNVSDKQQKKTTSPIKNSFIACDDDFDATLNQLDTSQFEDEYLLIAKNKVKSIAQKINEIDIADISKQKEKNDSAHEDHNVKSEIGKNSVQNQKKDISWLKNKEENVHDVKVERKTKTKNLSPLNKSKEKEEFETKVKNNIQNKTKHVKTAIQIEKVTKPDKHEHEDKDFDYNEIIQEKVEKKKHNAILYQNYLNRGGARNPGSKEIPKGAHQCLANLTFLITGVLDSLEREEAEGIIKQYGGKIVHTVSKKLNYLIVGEEAGPTKLAKAENFGIKKITENDFLDLLRTRPAGEENKELLTKCDIVNKRKRENSSNYNAQSSPILIKKNKEDSSLKNNDKSPSKPETPEEKLSTKEIKLLSENVIKSNSIDCLTAFVEKYRPKELKQIIGQTSDKSNAKKLQYWLTNWHKNHGKESKGKKSKFSHRDDTGTIYKAALLSGPPGIGKTTTAYVICAELRFEVLEFNASDTRSKKLLQEEIAGVLSNKSVKSFLTNTPITKEVLPKHVLLMDEVDGMAGNEDRGGMQELIAFIKSTEVPIICICNDRNSQKIKTLANYTFDLRFQKPRLEQIRAAMMSICFKEGIKINPDQLTQIIQSTNQDIRQSINHIALLSAKGQSVSESNEKIKYKNLKLGAWDVVRKVFSAEEHKNMNIHDKSDLFFHDYSIAPLFVEENYIIVTPAGPRNEVNLKLAKCSESLAIGDTIENCIRGKQTWSLLPVQAMFSSVIPGSVMSGYLHSQINFPSWLGKNSKRSKCDRILQEITVHVRITTGASKEAINLDYIKLLVDSIVRPLVLDGVEGIDKSIDVMNKYHLSREDLDSLIELTKWPHTRDPMQSVDSKTKTAFTKAYNKNALFSGTGTIKKKSSRDVQDDFLASEEEQVSDDNTDNEKIENDKLIKAKSSKSKSVSTESKTKKTVKANASRVKKK